MREILLVICILCTVQIDAQNRQLLNAIKSKNREYRLNELNAASSYADVQTYQSIYKILPKSTSEAKIDILNWISNEAKDSEKKEILREFEVRFEVPGRQVLVKLLEDKDIEVRKATVKSLVHISDSRTISALVNLLLSSDQEMVVFTGQALVYFTGGIEESVAKAIPKAGDIGKIAGIELLATRKAKANNNAIFNETRSLSEKVKTTAYKALKDVVGENDFVRLCGMLEIAEKEVVSPLQEAIITAISSQSADEQTNTIIRRMRQTDEEKKHLYYIPLAKTGTEQAIKIIKEGMNSRNQETRKEAEIVLSSIQ
ncbi:HEAT repeat domain-containing protein [Bacteroides sp. 214]|uniref:HEAT repeat domain-containing protein n=1 Tax=Bacteroides sp. 214 TaxID=2302935 RepID=UPI0013D6F9D0|nr:HEAT repeat domain-containing protein [Bacteroides sp. 214]